LLHEGPAQWRNRFLGKFRGQQLRIRPSAFNTATVQIIAQPRSGFAFTVVVQYLTDLVLGRQDGRICLDGSQLSLLDDYVSTVRHGSIVNFHIASLPFQPTDA
jgi:hypothetical protein